MAPVPSISALAVRHPNNGQSYSGSDQLFKVTRTSSLCDLDAVCVLVDSDPVLWLVEKETDSHVVLDLEVGP